MNTEITEPKNGWILYDGDCRLCITLVDRLRPLLLRYNFGLAPLQTPWVREQLGVPANAPLTEMALITTEGHRFGGADAILKSAEYIWWARPLARSAVMLGLRPLLRGAYRQIAAHRHCYNGACELPSVRNVSQPAAMWLPAILLPAVAIITTAASARWVVMWATAFSIWLACKWLTVWQARDIWQRTSTLRVVGYMLAWPGMNARTFLDPAQKMNAPSAASALPAVGRLLMGVALLWGFARLALETSPVLAAWIALVGMVSILHFGLFDLLAWCWQRLGVAAPCLMDRPTYSISVGQFWGRRWNLAFHELAQTFLFRPMRERFGPAWAVFAVFIASGLIHDLVISLPARGGYGLPTAYFALQAAALLFERSKLGRRFGLGRGLRGRLYAVAIVALPVFWLFHPQFLAIVILPFMEAIGAI